MEKKRFLETESSIKTKQAHASTKGQRNLLVSAINIEQSLDTGYSISFSASFFAYLFINSHNQGGTL